MIKILLSSCALLLIFKSCTDLSTNYASPQASRSIDESRKKKVFVKKFEIERSIFYITTNKRFEINEIWIEKVWLNSRSQSKVKVLKNSLQMVISCKKDNDLDGFLKYWGIELDTFNYGLCNGNICIDIDSKHSTYYKLNVLRFKKEYEFEDFDVIDSLIVKD